MNAAAIFQLISAGLTILPQLIQAGIDVTQRIEAIKTVSDAAAGGTLTDEQITIYRAQLDQDLADFNAPMDGA